MHPFSFSSLRGSALFIDGLATLIPAKYLNDAASQVEDVRYLKKAERESVKEAFKRKFKEDKRQKLDPRAAQQKPAKAADIKKTAETERIKNPQMVNGGPAAATETAAPMAINKSDNKSGNEALRLKLQKRLQEMRRQRKADEQKEKVKSVEDWKEAAMGVGRKKAAAQQRQAQRQKTSKAAVLDEIDDGSKNPRQMKKNRGTVEGQPQGQGQRAGKGGKKTGDQPNDFSFGKLEFGGDDGHHGHQHNKKRKSKPSKLDLLEQVEKDQQRVLTKAEEKTKAWKAALARAHGEKVLDDAKLLRKSIKKDAKIAEKKQKAWSERMEKVKEQKQQKQQKRKANLQSRIDAKRDKKIQRREKKLAGGNRAGFEGRKSTPIKKG